MNSPEKSSQPASNSSPSRGDRAAYASDQSQRHCDPAAAIQRLAGAVDLYKELLATFFSGADESQRVIRRAVEQDDSDGVHRAAHQMRGVAATCGAVGIVRLTELLEKRGQAKRLEGCLELCDELSAEIPRARRELAEYLPPAANT